MKRALIISPYFPPTNAADMQRVRMTLPYLSDLGWEAEIVTVGTAYSDFPTDNLLYESIPPETITHFVGAFPKWLTSKIGLGSIAIRSMWFYLRKVNTLLKKKKYDLVYFSTTQFPVCILGAYWKRRFGIPYVIDIQDPWHSEYYQDKPSNERPSKYWFSYRLNKFLEPLAIKEVSGLISVSEAYIDDLQQRYPEIKNIPSAVVTFGAFEKDFEIAKKNASQLNSSIKPQIGKIHLVYVGRGGNDMHFSVRLLFMALLKGLSSEPELFKQFHVYFIGTSYAAAGNGKKSIMPLADIMGIKDHVTETTDRISFYETITTLQNSDILFIPGSDDPKYSASKLYPYLLSQKPILSIFQKESSAVEIIKTCSPDALVFTFPGNEEDLINDIYNQLLKWSTGNLSNLILDRDEFSKYHASKMAARQTELFDCVLSN